MGKLWRRSYHASAAAVPCGLQRVQTDASNEVKRTRTGGFTGT